MAQFDVFPNPTAAQREAYPYFVVVQSDLLQPFSTRLAMPLSRSRVDASELPRRLTQTVQVAGEQLRLAPHLCTALPVRVLREPVASLRTQSQLFIDALDAVVSGV
jgi:toxin CcdB